MNKDGAGGTAVTVRLSMYHEIGTPPSMTGGSGFEQVKVVAVRGARVSGGIPTPNPRASSYSTIPMQRQVRFADRLGQTSGGDVLGSPTAEKISADEKVPNADVTTGGNAHVGEREGSGAGGFGGSGEGVGSGDLGEGKGFGVGSVGGSPSGSVGIGAAVGKPIYSIEWRGQGTRSKTSGILPSFPQGVKKSAQIKIQVTVLPDGTTGQMMPIQKGDTQLEDSAMRALRSWKFAPLRQNEQQAEQTVVVTFYFKLE